MNTNLVGFRYSKFLFNFFILPELGLGSKGLKQLNLIIMSGMLVFIEKLLLRTFQ